MDTWAQRTEKVFLSILQQNGDKEDINRRIRYFKDEDWQRLYAFCIANRLLPAFYLRLLSLKLENIPAEFLHRLKTTYLTNFRKNIILKKELLRILSCFKEKNILVIPLKGPILAEYLYNDLSSWVSCDLDLLVQDKQYEDAEGALEKNGYKPRFGKKDVFLRQFHLKYSKQLSFMRQIENEGEDEK